MPKLIVLVGPPGSGKSTLALSNCRSNEFVEDGNLYVNQDSQGKEGHLKAFEFALKNKANIYLDRMNFDKKQRSRYLNPAKAAGYETEIIVLHQNYETCLNRMRKRNDHPTIRDEDSARSALGTFFKFYQRPEVGEADKVIFVYPNITMKSNAIQIDIDNTLSDASHRERHLQGEKKRWKAFFDEMDKDPVNEFCHLMINKFKEDHVIILSSGRPDSYRKVTEKWLADNNIHYDYLFMRPRDDSRPDQIVKEIIYDFEVKTRVNNLRFALDDRDSVIKMMRSRGVRVLDVAGNTF